MNHFLLFPRLFYLVDFGRLRKYGTREIICVYRLNYSFSQLIINLTYTCVSRYWKMVKIVGNE